eukprot:COSAG02_NODE_58592_length_277_cov_0.561798_1_plen_40_part_01
MILHHMALEISACLIELEHTSHATLKPTRAARSDSPPYGA